MPEQTRPGPAGGNRGRKSVDLPWRWRARLPYRQALVEQRQARDAILAGTGSEEIWLLEHDPVVTTGRRPVTDLDPAILAGRGIDLVATERGGLATWHGPGQLVAYLLIDAHGRGFGARHLVAAVEQVLIDWLAQQGVPARRRAGLPGVWSGDAKLAAVGLHLSRGVTMHGLALNLDPDLSAFRLFTPCGVTDGSVTSLSGLLGHAPTPREAADQLGPRLSRALRRGPSHNSAQQTVDDVAERQ